VPLHGWLTPREQLPGEKEREREREKERERERGDLCNAVEERVRVERGNRKREKTRHKKRERVRKERRETRRETRGERERKKRKKEKWRKISRLQVEMTAAFLLPSHSMVMPCKLY